MTIIPVCLMSSSSESWFLSLPTPSTTFVLISVSSLSWFVIESSPSGYRGYYLLHQHPSQSPQPVIAGCQRWLTTLATSPKLFLSHVEGESSTAWSDLQAVVWEWLTALDVRFISLRNSLSAALMTAYGEYGLTNWLFVREHLDCFLCIGSIGFKI